MIALKKPLQSLNPRPSQRLQSSKRNLITSLYTQPMTLTKRNNSKEAI